MAIRYRPQRKHWEVYWRNPYTLRTQTAVFTDQGEAVKHDAWIKYKLKFEKEYFLPTEKESKAPDDSLEATYYLYLKEKQFSVKMLRWNMPAMKLPLEMIGRKRISAITTADLACVLAKHLAGEIKTVTARDRMKVLFTVLRWARKRGLLAHLPDFPELPQAHYKPIEIPTQAEVQAIAAGVDIGTVAKLMGHASPAMVLDHYQHVLTRQKKAAVEALPALGLYGRDCMGKKNWSPIQ